MTDQEIRELVQNEFTQKTLGVTEQYLEIHKPVYENNFPKVVRIDRKNDYTVVYVPVENEHFLFEVYVDEDDSKIYSIGTLSRNTISLIATSDKLSANELSSFTKLQVTKHWNKGDARFKNKIVKHTFNAIIIEPSIEPGEFEDVLKNLLNYLLKDKEGIEVLVSKADVYIDVVMDFHAGNQHFGTPYIDAESIGIMNELNLPIRMDIWASGSPFE